jgi:AhpD family alkylhydroperoxidase
MAPNPSFLEKYEEFSKAVYASDVLPAKIVELIAFSSSVAASCEHCMRHHYKKALQSGATDAELSLAMAVAMAIQSGKCRTLGNAAMDSVKAERKG